MTPSIPRTAWSPGQLERRWNDKLASVQALEEEIALLNAAPGPSLSSEDRERLLRLGRDLACAWDRSGTTIETRKKIIRLLIAEIIVDISNTLDLISHWRRRSYAPNG